MELKKLEVQLTEAYSMLDELRSKMADDANHCAAYAFTLETMKAEFILAGTIQGKNETERAASTRSLLKSAYESIDDADRVFRRSRANFENAERRVEYLRALLRIAELTASKPD